MSGPCTLWRAAERRAADRASLARCLPGARVSRGPGASGSRGSTPSRRVLRANGTWSGRSASSRARSRYACVADHGHHAAHQRHHREHAAAGEPLDLVEVAVRPRHQQLVLGRAPEGARHRARRRPGRHRAVARRARPRPRPWPRPRGGRPGRRAPAPTRRGPGRAPAARPRRRRRTRPAPRGGPAPARPGRRRRRRPRPAARGAPRTLADAGERAQRRHPVLGLVGQLGGHGAPAARAGPGPRRAGPQLGGAQRQRQERLDDARAALGAQHAEHAAEHVVGRQLALDQHVPGRGDRQRPRERVGQRARPARASCAGTARRCGPPRRSGPRR